MFSMITFPLTREVFGGNSSSPQEDKNNLFWMEQDRLESEVRLLERQLLQVREEYQDEVTRNEVLQQRVEETELQLEEQTLQIDQLVLLQQRQEQQQYPIVPQLQRPQQPRQQQEGGGEDSENGVLLEEIESLRYELQEVQMLYERELGKTQMLQQIMEQRDMDDVVQLLEELQEEGIQRQLILEEQEQQIADLESQLNGD